MEPKRNRIDGWKAIAAHVGRDRSTVIRWSRERGLPVHSVPGGGGNRTVFALPDELDVWLRGDDTKTHSTSPLPASAAADPPARADVWRRAAMIAALGLLVSLVAAWIGAMVAPAPSLPPIEPAILRARDMANERSPAKIMAAIEALNRLAASRPRDPAPHSALAETYLLAREFGGIGDTAAFAIARSEANMALALDSRDPLAWRARGFIAYWSDHASEAAGDAFRRAVALAPGDALAHLWYANALADAGDDGSAMREFGLARQINPGQAFLLADAAWASWSAGRTLEARKALMELGRDHAEVASVEDCLSVVALADGDFEGYADHLRGRAAARGAVALAAYSALVDEAVARGDWAALYRVMLSRALTFAEGEVKPDHSWAAFVSSTFGDREQLLRLLRTAIADGERWGAAGYRRRIAERWRADRPVTVALRALAAPSIEPAPPLKLPFATINDVLRRAVGSLAR